MVTGIFTSSWQKIGRADEHINTLKAELVKWKNRRPYKPVKKHDRKGQRHSFFVRVKHEPPIERCALLAGDAIHNLRAALDHVLFAAVQHKRTQPLTAKEQRSIQFPIVDDPTNYPAQKSRWLSLVTNNKLLWAIESVQPYKRPHAEVPPLLGLLRDFDDTDKHRLLNVVLTDVQQAHASIEWPDPTPQVTFNQYGGPVKDGSELARIIVTPPHRELKWKYEAIIVVSIAHPPGRNGREHTEIAAILDWLRNEVIFIVNEVGKVVF